MRGVILQYRRVLVVLVHVALWTLAYVVAFLLRFEFQIPAFYWERMPIWLAQLLVTRVAVHFALGLFHGLWRYTGSRDLVSLVKGATISSLVFVVVEFFIGPQGHPRTIFVLECLGSIALVGGVRFGIRAIREIAVQNAQRALPGRK